MSLRRRDLRFLKALVGLYGLAGVVYFTVIPFLGIALIVVGLPLLLFWHFDD